MIHAIPPQPGFTALRAEWEQAVKDDGTGGKVRNNKPGAEGHAGIAGLNQGGTGKTHRMQRLALRSALADIASISPVPVPHDIPVDHIQVAAYYIYEKGLRDILPEANWIRAIRQLRRTKVQQEAQQKQAE
jgi:hypothetical protein